MPYSAALTNRFLRMLKRQPADVRGKALRAVVASGICEDSMIPVSWTGAFKH
jgi:NADH:ubiquinone oxidoreductase subunit